MGRDWRMRSFGWDVVLRHPLFIGNSGEEGICAARSAREPRAVQFGWGDTFLCTSYSDNRMILSMYSLTTEPTSLKLRRPGEEGRDAAARRPIKRKRAGRPRHYGGSLLCADATK